MPLMRRKSMTTKRTSPAFRLHGAQLDALDDFVHRAEEQEPLQLQDVDVLAQLIQLGLMLR